MDDVGAWLKELQSYFSSEKEDLRQLTEEASQLGKAARDRYSSTKLARLDAASNLSI